MCECVDAGSQRMEKSLSSRNSYKVKIENRNATQSVVYQHQRGNED